jgi:hypothetical protein
LKDNLVISKKRKNILWTIILILLILWALGVSFGGLGAGGGLIHLIIVVAVIVLILQLVRGRRA